MDTSLIIGLLLVFVVGFFAFQWWSKSKKRQAPGRRNAVPAFAPSPTASQVNGPPPAIVTAASIQPEPQVEQPVYPEVAGQTEAEMRAKEPLQRPREANAPPLQQPVTNDGLGPAKFQENLRHPEQLFHQPAGLTATPSMTISDVPSGRAAQSSTPLSGNQQSFSPEYAQNGGTMVGNSVFAFDGMEPTGFSSF